MVNQWRALSLVTNPGGDLTMPPSKWAPVDELPLTGRNIRVCAPKPYISS